MDAESDSSQSSAATTEGNVSRNWSVSARRRMTKVRLQIMLAVKLWRIPIGRIVLLIVSGNSDLGQLHRVARQ